MDGRDEVEDDRSLQKPTHGRVIDHCFARLSETGRWPGHLFLVNLDRLVDGSPLMVAKLVKPAAMLSAYSFYCCQFSSTGRVGS